MVFLKRITRRDFSIFIIHIHVLSLTLCRKLSDAYDILHGIQSKLNFLKAAQKFGQGQWAIIVLSEENSQFVLHFLMHIHVQCTCFYNVQKELIPMMQSKLNNLNCFKSWPKLKPCIESWTTYKHMYCTHST